MRKNILKYCLFGLVSLIILSVVWLSTTRNGLQASIYIVNHLFAKNIQITNPSGSFITKITADQIEVSNQQLDLVANNIEVKCPWFYLLFGHLDLHKLHIKTVNLTLHAKEHSGVNRKKKNLFATIFKRKRDHILTQQKSQIKKFLAHPPTLKTTLHIKIDDLQIDNITITTASQKIFNINHIKLQARMHRSLLTISKAYIVTKLYQLQLHGEINCRQKWQTNLHGILLSKFNNNYDLQNQFTLIGNLARELTFKLTGKLMPLSSSTTTIQPSKTIDILTVTLNNMQNLGKIDAHGDWSNLTIPFGDKNVITVQKGKLLLSGTLDDYKLQLNLNANIKKTTGKTTDKTTGLLKSNINLQGRGNLTSLDLSSINITTNYGAINGNLNLIWQSPNPILTTDLHISNLNLSFIQPTLKSKINCQLASKINLRNLSNENENGNNTAKQTNTNKTKLLLSKYIAGSALLRWHRTTDLDITNMQIGS